MLPPDIELTVTPPVHLYQHTRDFLGFLRTAARKHSVTISFSANVAGTFKLSVPGKECWSLDSFLQEITFQHGLYYYLCGATNRRELARLVVRPVFEGLQASRFRIVYRYRSGLGECIGGD
jgi:hypothetical protein